MRTVKDWLPAWKLKVESDSLMLPLMKDILDFEAESLEEAKFIVNMRFANLFGWIATFKP